MKEISDSETHNCSKQNYVQTELELGISATERVYTPNPRWDSLSNTHDPYWDFLEQEQATQQQDSCDILDQTSVVSVGTYPADPIRDTDNEIFRISAHQLLHSVGEQFFMESNELTPSAHQQCFCVGEQVIDDTNLHISESIVGEQVSDATNSHISEIIVGEQVKHHTQKLAHQQCFSVGEQVIDDTNLHISESIVGEQVKHHTQKPALPNEQPAHWIERYWVERGGNKYWYYRYTWMAGRKMHRVYIGSTRSRRVQEKVEWIREAIADGKSPDEIKQLIKGEYD